jgi:hypothetical protein
VIDALTGGILSKRYEQQRCDWPVQAEKDGCLPYRSRVLPIIAARDTYP